MYELDPAGAARHQRGSRVLLLSLGVLVVVSVVALILRAARPARVALVQSVGAHAGLAAPAPAIAANVELSPSTIPQGGAFTVRLQASGVAAASADFNGQSYPMVLDGGTWYAIVGVGQRVGSIQILAAGTYPVTVRYQLAGSRAVVSSELKLAVAPTQFPLDSIDLSNGQTALLAPEVEASESAVLSQAYGAFTPRQLWLGAFSPPVNGAVTTAFGARRAYQGGPPIDSHPGIDLAVPLGTPVHASAAGVVAWTGELPDRGNGVIIDHGLGVFTGYFHLSQIDAQMGQAVRAGDVIGLAGSTGLSTGPHVHWEVVIGDTNVDGLQIAKEALP